MSEFKDIEERLVREPPAAPRPGLRDEVLRSVHRELRAVPLGRFVVAAGLLIAALLAMKIEEFGHRQRVAAILAEGADPRIERALQELTPFRLTGPLEVRLKLDARRKSDQRWAGYMTARFKAGADHG